MTTVTFNWYDHTQQTLVIRMQPNWTWHDFRAVYSTYQAHIQAQSHLVAIIVDLRQDRHMPRGTLHEMHNAVGKVDRNIGAIVVIGGHPSGIALWHIFNQVYHVFDEQPVIFVAAFEEAEAAIAEWRHQLQVSQQTSD